MSIGRACVRLDQKEELSRITVFAYVDGPPTEKGL